MQKLHREISAAALDENGRTIPLERGIIVMTGLRNSRSRRLAPDRWRRVCGALLLLSLATVCSAQTCVAPIPLWPNSGPVGGNSCNHNEPVAVLCNQVGETGPVVVYAIEAERLSGFIDIAADFTSFLAVKNANCLKGDCISSTPGSPILFSPDMQGPFLIVVAADPKMESPGACGDYTLFPSVHVIEDLLMADGFDRSTLPQASVNVPQPD